MSALPLSVPELQPGASAPDPAVPAGPRTSLSPSRAADFMTCPLLYRFRVLDRLPEAPSPAAVRGTVVHEVLERLFGLPAAERTVERAVALVPAAWDGLLEQEPDTGDMFDPPTRSPPGSRARRRCCDKYFEPEDPPARARRARAARRDRRWPTASCCAGSSTASTSRRGAIRVVDYKTGRAPREGSRPKALFQMRFYALVLWRRPGSCPALLQLMYLGDGEVLRYEPGRGRPARHRAQGRGRCGRRSPGPPTTGDCARARAGSATGATTGDLPRLGRHPAAAAGRGRERPRPRRALPGATQGEARGSPPGR